MNYAKLIFALSLFCLYTVRAAHGQDLEVGLATCARISDEHSRTRCVEVMRKSAPCWKFSGQERQSCLDVASNGPVQDICERAADRERCKQFQTCAGKRGSSRRECLTFVESQQPPRLANCSLRLAPDERLVCELRNRTVESCRSENAAKAHECVAQRFPIQQVRDGINSLDCRTPDATLETVCRLRNELVAGCETFDEADHAHCLDHFAKFRLLDCDRLPEKIRGRCTAYNAGFEACTGKRGADLAQCHKPFHAVQRIAPSCGYATSGEKNLSLESANCMEVDNAFGHCALQHLSAVEFPDCVESRLSLTFKARRWVERHPPPH